ncbi:deoxyribodipyrimidine photo-lyase [Desulfogranum mediterraneum]|uniref:deoxyribodipyrimidine photo-lyase n=1 Tax=Desulfogranum mediterraneum TaxID=160661 RepID=UPI00041B4B7C|nr:deoxyribodipyrimidine photo-lyase [Desulfogranum mediterraneum]
MDRRNPDSHRRCRCLSPGRTGAGPVIYWMSRDQRLKDNWALLWAQEEALLHHKPLQVLFCCMRDYPGANLRHYDFMLQAMAELGQGLRQHNIELVLLAGEPAALLPAYVEQSDAHALVTDFDPLRIKQLWKKQLASRLKVPLFEVDSHNIIPAWVTSDKKEYAAYTIRPKINRLLDDYLTDIPRLRIHPLTCAPPGPSAAPAELLKTVADRQTGPVSWLKPGAAAAAQAAEAFLGKGLAGYALRRNNPCLAGQSGLSPYLHFGQLSAQRLAWLVRHSTAAEQDREAFLEELIVRRELSDNFCLYEPDYDRFAGFPRWARTTLEAHRGDQREYSYSLSQLEQAATHEALWNSCQQDLMIRGKLHGYLRMYWAKKILEWTREPEEALEYAIALNDRYSLDGRDPNGYTGIAWSIGGVHDRAWRERPVFGKVRYMNLAGCRRKFDVEGYINSVGR